MSVGQAKLIWNAILRIPGAPSLGDFQKAKGLTLSHRRRNSMTMKAVFNELIEGHRQLAVVLAAMLRKLISTYRGSGEPTD